MSYSVSPTPDPVYGTIEGYGVLSAVPTSSPATTPAPSQVITVTHGQTIAFYNFGPAAHTASLLGVANGMNWPLTFTNTNGARCTPVLNENITDSNFSTCNVGSGRFSLMFSTGPLTGMFYFGDFYDYIPNPPNPPMRTVIIVQ